MAHDASNNNPTKEIIHSLLGISLLLVIILGIAISAWLRPAGNHEPATEPATKAGQMLAEKISAIENPTPEKPAETTQAVFPAKLSHLFTIPKDDDFLQSAAYLALKKQILEVMSTPETREM